MTRDFRIFTNANYERIRNRDRVPDLKCPGIVFVVLSSVLRKTKRIPAPPQGARSNNPPPHGFKADVRFGSSERSRPRARL